MHQQCKCLSYDILFGVGTRSALRCGSACVRSPVAPGPLGRSHCAWRNARLEHRSTNAPYRLSWLARQQPRRKRFPRCPETLCGRLGMLRSRGNAHKPRRARSCTPHFTTAQLHVPSLPAGKSLPVHEAEIHCGQGCTEQTKFLPGNLVPAALSPPARYSMCVSQCRSRARARACQFEVLPTDFAPCPRASL